MEKRSLIDSLELTRSGTVRLRLLKQIIDSDKVLLSEPHRAELPAQMGLGEALDMIDASLVSIGYPAISGDDRSWLGAVFGGTPAQPPHKKAKPQDTVA